MEITLLNELTETRVIDKHFRAQIDKDKVFKEEDIETYPEDALTEGPKLYNYYFSIFGTEKMTKKKPVFGALPLPDVPSRAHNH
ncbi:Hypothetical predicted protein [Paramuricea clavata]|uniref:Uncharacterized protein n=1 Tax=Paramuricea clavata TaxID=317549 RepID=A0A6S7LTE0_PARCT|nr:Hypothetical predicted protein [Paramuricea clavata]